MNKKVLTSLLLAGTMAFSLTACDTGNSSDAFTLNKTQDVYAYSAVSAVTVLADFNTQTMSTVSSVLSATRNIKALTTDESTEQSGENTQTGEGGQNTESGENGSVGGHGHSHHGRYESEEDRYKTYVDNVNKYMAIAENMMGDNGFTFTDVESDREGFAYKVAITYSDINAETLEYAMYYNVVNEVVDEGETEVDIEGVFVNGELEYAILGNQEIEDDENELELIIRMDEENYVTVEYETERDETGYVYSVYQGGQLIEKTAFEKEEKFFGGTEVEIELLKDGITTVFELEEKQEKGKTFIQGNVEEDGERFSFKIMVIVDEETGESTYQYLFGNKPFERQRHRHYHGRAPQGRR